jgi:cobalt-zinc-cadmium efflux system protein
MSRIHNHPQDAEIVTNGAVTSRLALSILLNLIITLAEILGGLISGSLSLLSDALHNFSDTASLGISLATVKISARNPDRQKTFGYRRAQIIGALINLVLLVVVAIYLIMEAIERYMHPQPIQGRVMLIVAVIGLLANLATAALLYRQSRGSLNIRSAFIHILSDAFSSVGVVIAGLLITRFQLYVADTLLTLLISAYILIHSAMLLRQTVNILMQGVPEGIDIDMIIAAVRSVEDVQDIHHVHIWQLDESITNLEAHIVIDQCKIEDMTCIKQAIRQRLASSFNITHSTLEFEFEDCGTHSIESCYEVEHID